MGFTSGPRNPNAKLDWGVVREIRAMYAGGMSQGAIGRELGVPTQTIGRIVRGDSWIENPRAGGVAKGQVRPPLTGEELHAAALRTMAVQAEVDAARQGKVEPPTMPGMPGKPPMTLDEIIRRESLMTSEEEQAAARVEARMRGEMQAASPLGLPPSGNVSPEEARKAYMKAAQEKVRKDRMDAAVERAGDGGLEELMRGD